MKVEPERRSGWSTTDQGGARRTREPGGMMGHGGVEGARSQGGADGSEGRGGVKTVIKDDGG